MWKTLMSAAGGACSRKSIQSNPIPEARAGSQPTLGLVHSTTRRLDDDDDEPWDTESQPPFARRIESSLGITHNVRKGRR